MTAAAVQPETETPTKALARRPSTVTILRPIAPAAEVIVAQNETRELIEKALKKDRDFGTIKGTKKPTLYKAGAERIVIAFGCFARFRTLASEVDHDREVKWTKREKVWRNKFKGDKEFTWKEEVGVSQGLYRYVIECEIVDRETGNVVGSFVGSCSSMESKYVDRPRDVENTILKMAEKRALVGAGLTTFGLSDQFTQDVEDLPRDVVQNGQSANPAGDVEEVVDVEVVKDLAWAKAFPLPWPKHKHYGEPIDSRDTKELEGALTWTESKIRQAGLDGRDLAPTDMLVEFAEALRLVLAPRKEEAKRDQTKLALESTEEVRPVSTSVPMPPAGKVADALEPKEDPTSTRAFHKKIKKLLEHPTAISKEDRAAYADDNVNGFKKHPIQWWVRSFENDVRVAEMAGKANDAASTLPNDQTGGFPSALLQDDDDGLPF